MLSQLRVINRTPPGPWVLAELQNFSGEQTKAGQPHHSCLLASSPLLFSILDESHFVTAVGTRHWWWWVLLPRERARSVLCQPRCGGDGSYSLLQSPALLNAAFGASGIHLLPLVLLQPRGLCGQQTLVPKRRPWQGRADRPLALVGFKPPALKCKWQVLAPLCLLEHPPVSFMRL